MRSLLQPQVLAAEVPAGVHQLDGVERAATRPRRTGGVCRAAVEHVLHRDEAERRERLAIRCAELVVDVAAEHDVRVLEDAGAHEVRLRAQQLFGDAGNELQRATDVVLLHDLLDGKRRDHIYRAARVVAFAVTGCAFDERRVIRHARLL